jgi:glutathione S-transferase
MFYDRTDKVIDINKSSNWKPLSPNGEASAQKLLNVAHLLIPEDGGNLFGEYSIVDSEFAFMLQRLLLNSYQVPDKVKKYVQTQWERPSVKEFVDHKRKPFVPY